MTQGNEITVPMESVYENAWNYNRQDEDTFEKQIHSIEKFGYVQPIIVREVEGRYEIINGAHRYRALQHLGVQEVAVWNLGNVSEEDAQQLTIVLNELKGRPDIDSLSSLLKDLDDQIGRIELIETLPYSEQAIADMINTLDFSWDAFEQDDEDIAATPPPKDLVRIEFRVSAEQAKFIQETIKEAMEFFSLEDTDNGKAAAIVQICELFRER